MKNENYWDSSSVAHNKEPLSKLIDSMLEMINGVVLYENSDMTRIDADYNAILNDNISNYRYYEVLVSRFQNASSWMTTGKIPFGKGTFISSAEGSTSYYRDISCPASGNYITFKYNTETNANRCIPRIIKGY